METADAETDDGSHGEYTKDGTVDLRGRQCVRAKGGGWRACSFIAAYEAMERVAYFGIAPNLVIYLTEKLHQGTVASANNVTNWIGTLMLTPILGAYLADAHFGQFWTFIFAAIVYLLGMVILTLAVSLDSLRPPTCSSSNPDYCSTLTKHYQIVIFFLALYIIALGAGGTKPNIQTLGAEQFDVLDSKERARKFSFFNWWTFAAFCGNLFSTTVLIYIQNSVSWSIGYGVPTAGLSIAIAVFLLGSPFYRHKPPSGSPVVRVAKVLVAAVRNWSFRLPEDPKTLHELDSEQYGQAKRRIDHSSSLRFLDKAAVKTGSDGEWHLCSVTQVEETKQIIKLLPIFAATIVPSVMLAQVLTLFIKQGTTLDRRIGPRFSIPPGNLSSFFMIATIIVIPAYDRGFVPLLRKYTNNPRGITMLQRIGLGLFLHVLVMVMASFVEKWRLTIVRSHGLAHQKATVPLTVFALAPQFVLMGVAEMLVEVGKMEFFYDQAPQGMKSLGSSFFTSSLAIGNFMSSFILSTTAKITREGGRNGWIENNLNASRLDNYYLFFAVLNVGNLLFFFVVSRFFVYNREGTSSEKELKQQEEVFPDERGIMFEQLAA